MSRRMAAHTEDLAARSLYWTHWGARCTGCLKVSLMGCNMLDLHDLATAQSLRYTLVRLSSVPPRLMGL
jgi:hypothetical protein